MICFNIVHVNTKSSMMLHQSIYTQSSFFTHYSRYNRSIALFHADHPPRQGWKQSDFSTNDCLLIRLNPFAFSHSPSTYVFRKRQRLWSRKAIFPRNYSTERPTTHWWAHWSFQTLLVFRHLGFLATLFTVHPIFLRRSVHDTTLYNVQIIIS